MHRHPRPADGGCVLRPAGASDYRRAAPLRGEPAGGPGAEGGKSPHAGAVGHAHSPDAGADYLRRSGCVGDERAAPGAAKGGHLRRGRELPAAGEPIHSQAGGGGASGIHRVPAGGPGGPHPRRAQGRCGLRQDPAGDGVPGPAGLPAPREDEAQGKGKGHGRLRRRERGHFGGHHGGGGRRGCAQRHLHGGGERRALRPFTASPAPGPGGPWPGEKLLHFAVGAPVGGDEAAAEGDDPNQRRI